MKMSGGAKVGDAVYSKITGLYMGNIAKDEGQDYIFTGNLNKVSEELVWSTFKPDPETVKLSKEKQTNFAKINDYAYDMTNRLIGQITSESPAYNSFTIKPSETGFKGMISLAKYIEGISWYSKKEKDETNGISTYDLRLKDAKARVVDKLKHSTNSSNPTKSIRRSPVDYSIKNEDIPEINNSYTKLLKKKSSSEFESNV